MLKKRLVGVITVRNGWVVQSFGYNRYLPIGHPTVVAENLDRWGVDEILVLAIDRSKKVLGPDFELLKTLSDMSLSTPITYGGGVKTVEQASLVVQLGAERVCLDAALFGDLRVIRDICHHVGSQAVVATMPLSIKDGHLMWDNYLTKVQLNAEQEIPRLFQDGAISEALIIDWQHEGTPNGFDLNLLRKFPLPNIPLIAFGGLSDIEQLQSALSFKQVVAVGIGNFLNYTEHAVQDYRERLASDLLRPPEYRGPIF